MSSIAPPPPSAPDIAPLSQVARIVNTFVAPEKTFNDLRRSAAWWAPFLLLAVVSVAFVYTVDKKVGFRKVSDNQVQMSPKATRRMDQMNAVDREQAMQRQAKITGYISYGFWAFILIWYVLVAAVLLATFKFGAGASDLTFSRTFAVVMFAALPQVLRSLLAIASLLAGVSPDGFTFQNPVGTNPGFYMTPGDSPFLYSVATSLDLFMVWTLALTAIGLSCVSKLKRSTAMFGVFGWYVVLTLCSAGLAAATQ
jgi:Yip1-like protein